MSESDRVVRVVHALLYAQEEAAMPVTAAEICIYDDLSPNAKSTAAALKQAAGLGLAVFTGRYWLATNAAMNRRSEFERRALALQDMEEQ